jgi:hypothetical protein
LKVKGLLTLEQLITGPLSEKLMAELAMANVRLEETRGQVKGRAWSGGSLPGPSAMVHHHGLGMLLSMAGTTIAWGWNGEPVGGRSLWRFVCVTAAERVELVASPCSRLDLT